MTQNGCLILIENDKLSELLGRSSFRTAEDLSNSIPIGQDILYDDPSLTKRNRLSIGAVQSFFFIEDALYLDVSNKGDGYKRYLIELNDFIGFASQEELNKNKDRLSDYAASFLIEPILPIESPTNEIAIDDKINKQETSKVKWRQYETTTGQEVLSDELGTLEPDAATLARMAIKDKVSKTPNSYRYFVIDEVDESGRSGQGLLVVHGTDYERFKTINERELTKEELIELSVKVDGQHYTIPMEGGLDNRDMFFHRQHEERLAIYQRETGKSQEEAEAFYRSGQKRLNDVRRASKDGPVQVGVKSVSQGTFWGEGEAIPDGMRLFKQTTGPLAGRVFAIDSEGVELPTNAEPIAETYPMEILEGIVEKLMGAEKAGTVVVNRDTRDVFDDVLSSDEKGFLITLFGISPRSKIYWDSRTNRLKAGKSTINSVETFRILLGDTWPITSNKVGNPNGQTIDYRNGNYISVSNETYLRSVLSTDGKKWTHNGVEVPYSANKYFLLDLEKYSRSGFPSANTYTSSALDYLNNLLNTPELYWEIYKSKSERDMNIKFIFPDLFSQDFIESDLGKRWIGGESAVINANGNFQIGGSEMSVLYSIGDGVNSMNPNFWINIDSGDGPNLMVSTSDVDYVSLDVFRQLSFSMGVWTKEMEVAYQAEQATVLPGGNLDVGSIPESIDLAYDGPANINDTESGMRNSKVSFNKTFKILVPSRATDSELLVIKSMSDSRSGMAGITAFVNISKAYFKLADVEASNGEESQDDFLSRLDRLPSVSSSKFKGLELYGYAESILGANFASRLFANDPAISRETINGYARYVGDERFSFTKVVPPKDFAISSSSIEKIESGVKTLSLRNERLDLNKSGLVLINNVMYDVQQIPAFNLDDAKRYLGMDDAGIRMAFSGETSPVFFADTAIKFFDGTGTAKVFTIKKIEEPSTIAEAITLPKKKTSTNFAKRLRALVKNIFLSDSLDPLIEMTDAFERSLSVSDRRDVLVWAGHKKWTKKTSDKFSKGFQKYLFDGEENSTLVKVFNKFKKWIINVVNPETYFKSVPDITPEIRGIYERLVETESVTIKSKKADITVEKDIVVIAESAITTSDLVVNNGNGIYTYKGMEYYTVPTSNSIFPGIMIVDKETYQKINNVDMMDIDEARKDISKRMIIGTVSPEKRTEVNRYNLRVEIGDFISIDGVPFEVSEYRSNPDVKTFKIKPVGGGDIVTVQKSSDIQDLIILNKPKIPIFPIGRIVDDVESAIMNNETDKYIDRIIQCKIF